MTAPTTTPTVKRIEALNDFVIKFANVNGSGSASANELFAKSFLRMGYGYQTWLLHNERQFRLWGARGQGVYVDAATKAVVVHTAVTADRGDPVPEQYWLFQGVLASLK